MNDRRYMLFEPTEFAYSEQKVAFRGQHYQRTVADLTLQTRGWNVDRPYGLWLGVSPHSSEERYVEVELDGKSGRVRLDPQVRPETVWTRVATVSLRDTFLQMRVSAPEATLRGFDGVILSDDLGLNVPASVRTESDLHALFSDPSGFSELTPNRVVSCSRHEFRMTYTVGKEGIAVGGGILAFVEGSLWRETHTPQTEDPTAPGYVTVSHKGSGRIDITEVVEPVTGLHDRELGIRVTVSEAPLQPGDTITLVFGDRSGGGPGAQANVVCWTYTHNYKRAWWHRMPVLTVWVDSRANETFLPLERDHAHSFTVVTDEPAKLFVTAKAHAQAGVPHDLNIAVMDQFQALAQPAYTGIVRFACDREDVDLPGPVHLREGDGSHCRVTWVPQGEGTYVITAETDDGLSGTSNPVVSAAEMPGHRVYFGDIHSHSLYSGDAVGEIEAQYEHGRHVANLDFMCASEHAEYETDNQWVANQILVQRYHQPGEFVPISGFEWAYSDVDGEGHGLGHRNVYSENDYHQLLRGSAVATANLERLWHHLEGREDVLAFGHHPLMVLRWHQHNPKYERLLEMYSGWGNSEIRGNPEQPWGGQRGMSLQEVLAMEARVGVIAGSDNHDARPGYAGAGEQFSKSVADVLWKPSGLAVVWATGLTRKEIFEAWRARRTYGTSGQRILLSFKVNGHWMGSDIALAANDARRLVVNVIGTAPLAKVDVVKNNEDVHAWQNPEQGVDLVWEDSSAASTGDFYYIRVTQVDEEMAWSSPVWLDVT